MRARASFTMSGKIVVFIIAHLGCLLSVSAMLTEFKLGKTSESDCIGNANYVARAVGECSITCNSDTSCINFIYDSTSKRCRHCNEWVRENPLGGYAFGRKVFSDCSQSAINYTGYLVIRHLNSTKSFDVLCQDGWTVIQRRFDGSLNFDRPWNDYKEGFGTPDGELWLGNDNIHYITQQAQYRLRYIMTEWSGQIVTRDHASFALDSEKQKYRLSISPPNNTDITSATMETENGILFSAPDQDNDSAVSESCAEMTSSGWWFRDCAALHFNGYYPYADKCPVESWKCMHYKSNAKDIYFLKETVMKIKPSV